MGIITYQLSVHSLCFISYYYLELFIKIYPNISYEIKECKNKKSNNNGNKKNNYSMIPIFSIKGNFNEN